MTIDWHTHQARLRQAQLTALRQHASEDGDPFPLFHCLAVLSDRPALAEAIATTPADHPVRILFTEILEGIPPADHGTLLNLPFTTASWFVYAFTQQALSEGDIGRAVALATVLLLKKKRPYVGALNLVGNFLLSQEQDKIAAQIYERSLLVAPRQRDIAQQLAAIQSGSRIETRAPCLEPFPNSVRPIGFYLPVYNAANYLREVIPAILCQGYPLDALVLIDDASTDESCQIAGDYPVEVVCHTENRGLAAARNTGFNTLQSDYVATCDSDVRLDPNYLLHVDLELRSSREPLAAVGGRMTEAFQDTPPDRYRAIFLNQDTSTQRRNLNTRPLENYPGAETLNELYLPGCNTVMRRDAVLAAGGYDEQFRTACEDGDIYLKLAAAGHAMSTVPEARAYHLRRDTTLSVIHTNWRYNYWTMLRMGLFEDSTQLADNWVRSRNWCAERLRHFATLKCPEIALIHVANYVYCELRTYEEAGRHQGLTDVQQSRLQVALLQELRATDSDMGGDVFAYLLPLISRYLLPSSADLSLEPQEERRSLSDIVTPQLYRYMNSYNSHIVLPIDDTE